VSAIGHRSLDHSSEREPIEIDGSCHSGSGTIVRYSVALATLLCRPVHLINARVKRDQPGLRRQHLASVLAAAEVCGGSVEGATVGATAFTYRPGPSIRGGSYAWDIGTAGSATMLTLGLLPILAFADGPVEARVTGGIFQDFAPSPHHMKHVLASALAPMGLRVDVRVLRAGYVPHGVGILEVRVEPHSTPLAAFRRVEPLPVTHVQGIAFASHLADRRVSERMARSCTDRLAEAGVTSEIACIDDREAAQAGAGLAIWNEGPPGIHVGADQAGRRGRTSESIGRFVADALRSDLATGATVDRHLADMLVVFAALARGTTEYVVPAITDHVDSNLWLVETFGARTRVVDRCVRVEGLSLPPRV
jgi:RNA 3'-terminal phosphate cyclase (ATP)